MKNASRALNRQEYVEVQLRQWIMTGRYVSGAWLPSIAQLCQRFQVSDTTVKLALDRLKNDGLIKGFNGKGLQVSRRQKKVLLLGYGLFSTDSKNSEDDGLIRQAVEGWHEKFEEFGREPDDAIGANLEKHAEAIQSADVIVTFSIQSEDYHIRLAKFKKPVLAIDFCPQRAMINSVSFASYQAGYRATRHFLDQGHRRIAFVGMRRDVLVRVPRPHTVSLAETDTELALAGYRHALSDAGLPVQDTLVRRAEIAEAAGAMREVCAAPVAPTALVSWHAKQSVDAVRVLREAHLAVPQLAGICQLTVEPPPPEGAETLINYNRREVFDLAIERLHRLLEEPRTAPRIYQVIPVFREGHACTAPDA